MSGMGGHERAYRGETDVWLTPPDFLRTLGSFDLDPCACDEPRPWATAARHIVAAEDGLSQSWAGRVWLNPPYGAATGRWLARLADHGDGIALVFARTDTAWFQEIAPRADALLFLSGRLTFHRASGRSANANAGAPSALLAFGERNVNAIYAAGQDGFFAYPMRNASLQLTMRMAGQ